jgi:hypothetical protein
MHQTAIAAGSVDPNGSGASATVPNNKRDEIRFDRTDIVPRLSVACNETRERLRNKASPDQGVAFSVSSRHSAKLLSLRFGTSTFTRSLLAFTFAALKRNKMSRSRPTLSSLLGFWPLLALVVWLSVPGSAFTQGLQPPSQPDATQQTCQTIQDYEAKLRCYTDSNSRGALPQRGDYLADGWRLVRSPNPAGGQDAVSIMHTAETSKSDLGFAGLMLRCSQSGIEVLLVVVEPFPPRDHPKVTVATEASARAEFSASVITPGALVLLPPPALTLAEGPWQKAPELTVTVEDQKTSLRGAVPLGGLGPALQTLRSTCPAA